MLAHLKNITHSVTQIDRTPGTNGCDKNAVFVLKEEVIIEAANMENWRPVNVSFWQNFERNSSVNCGAHHASSCEECPQVVTS